MRYIFNFTLIQVVFLNYSLFFLFLIPKTSFEIMMSDFSFWMFKIILLFLTSGKCSHIIYTQKNTCSNPAFTSGKSIESALCEFQTTKAGTVDKKMSRTFDVVDHQILLSKLYRYDLNDRPLELIKSYLYKRSQYSSQFR